MPDEEQQGPSLQVVVDEGRKQNGQPKKLSNPPTSSPSADADRKQFVKDLQHIRGAVDRLVKDVEKLTAAQAQILDVARATGAVVTGNAKTHSDKLAQVFEAQSTEREHTRKALEYTQRVLTMVAANPKELERLRKIWSANDPVAGQLATGGHGKRGWWVAFWVGLAVVIVLAAVVLA